MLIRTLPTTLFEFFSKIIINSKVRSRRQFLEDLLSINGLKGKRRPGMFGRAVLEVQVHMQQEDLVQSEGKMPQATHI